MRPEFGRVDPVPGCDRLAIIAGGPSLAGVDLERLAEIKGATVIGVNESAARLPFVDIAFTIDSGNLRTRMPFYHGRKIAAVPADYLQPTARKRGWREPPVRPVEITLLLRQQHSALSRNRGVACHNGSSGSAALNVALHLEPRKVLLLGYDNRDLDRYWWGEGRVCSRPWQADLQFWATASVQLASCGIEVLNASAVSTIEAFPKAAPAEGIEWLSAR